MANKPSPDTTIALLAQDIGYIKGSVGKIEQTLSTMEKDFMRRTEFEAYKLEQGKINQNNELVLSNHAASISTNDISIATLKTQLRIWAIAGGSVLVITQSVVTALIIRAIVPH